MELLNSIKRASSRNKSERGLTLTELLVAMTIFVIIAGVSLTILFTSNQSVDRFGQTTTNQGELSNAINTINRDISASSRVTYASSWALQMASTEDGYGYTTKVFYYEPGLPLPTGFSVNTSNLPGYPSIVEQRQKVGDPNVTQNILVPGYNRCNQSVYLFKYYSSSGATETQLATSSASNDPNSATFYTCGTAHRDVKTLTAAETGSISRIEFYLASKVTDRSSTISLAGSASPHTLVAQGVTGGDLPSTPGAPTLTGTLPERSTTAHLSWNTPAGATSYTLYREAQNETTYTPIKVFSTPNINSYDDSGLTLGNIYTYYIVSFGPGGHSPNSNLVPLTVVPPQAVIVNINTKKQLSDQYTSSDTTTSAPTAVNQVYTVARGLVNQVSWKYANGATGYYIYRDGGTSPVGTINSGSTLSWQDTNVTYGDTHSYKVEAFNSGPNCTGVCDGALSSPVSLISPPVAPTITGSNNGATTNTVTINNTVANSSGTYIYAATADQQAASCASASQIDSLGAASGTSGSYSTINGRSTCYEAFAYNDAGQSQASNWAVVDAPPGDFSIININSTAPLSSNGTYYTVARGLNNQIVWSQSAGASGYQVFRDGSLLSTISNGTTTVYNDTSVNNGDTHSYYVKSLTAFPASSDGLTSAQPTLYKQTGSVNLVSPPVAPAINAVANDTSTNSTYSDNTVNITSMPANASSVTVNSSNDQGTNAPSCTNLSTVGSGTATSYNNSSVMWGYGRCYVAYASNDAGTSPASNNATALQLPGKFNVGTGSNVQNWFKLTNSNSSYDFQRTDDTGNKTNPSYDVNYSISWSASKNASFYDSLWGYRNNNPSSSARKESWSSNGYTTCNSANNSIMNSLMPSSLASSVKCYHPDADASTSTSLSSYVDLSPGAYYRFAVIAVAPDGLRRGDQSDISTAPAEPQFGASYIFEKSSVLACALRVQMIGNETTYGTADSVQGKVNFNIDSSPRDWSTMGSVNSSNTTWMGVHSNSMDPNSGSNASTGYARSVLSQYNFNGYSSTVAFHGVMPGGNCDVGSNGVWTALPESEYFAGAHSWYYARDNSPGTTGYTDSTYAPSAAQNSSAIQSWGNANLS